MRIDSIYQMTALRFEGTNWITSLTLKTSVSRFYLLIKKGQKILCYTNLRTAKRIKKTSCWPFSVTNSINPTFKNGIFSEGWMVDAI